MAVPEVAVTVADVPPAPVMVARPELTQGELKVTSVAVVNSVPLLSTRVAVTVVEPPADMDLELSSSTPFVKLAPLPLPIRTEHYCWSHRRSHWNRLT